jgi:hypothetical protein
LNCENAQKRILEAIRQWKVPANFESDCLWSARGLGTN